MLTASLPRYWILEFLVEVRHASCCTCIWCVHSVAEAIRIAYDLQKGLFLMFKETCSESSGYETGSCDLRVINLRCLVVAVSRSSAQHMYVPRYVLTIRAMYDSLRRWRQSFGPSNPRSSLGNTCSRCSCDFRELS